MKKVGLNGCVYDFTVYDKAFDIRDVTSVNKHFMKM